MSGTKGSVLMVTLWLVAVLSMTAVALAGYLSTEARLTGYRVARAQARQWAKTGV